MIVRNLDELKASGRYAENLGLWSSARYLLKDDGVGFTLTQTMLAAGIATTCRLSRICDWFVCSRLR